MKKILFILLLIIPFMVMAEETCDPNSIKIESIELEEKTDFVEEESQATFEGNSIGLNLRMHYIGDNAKYKLVITNTSDDDFELSSDMLNVSSDYIGCTLSTEDSSMIVKAGESKTIYLTAVYENEIPEELLENGIYNNKQKIVVGLSNDISDNTIERIGEEVKAINPNTSTGITIIAIVLITGILFVVFRKYKIAKYMVLGLGLAVVIPYTVYAICKSDLNIEFNITIEKERPFTGTIYQNSEDQFKIGDSIKLVTENKWCIFSTKIDQWFRCDDDEPEILRFDNEDECKDFLVDNDAPNYITCRERELVLSGMKDYTLDSSEIDTENYLKHDIENDIIVKTYVCNNYYDEELCLEFGKDYEFNKSKMTEYFTNHSGSCNTSSFNDTEYYACSFVDHFDRMELYEGGFMESGDRCGDYSMSYCYINNEGESSCKIDYSSCSD